MKKIVLYCLLAVYVLTIQVQAINYTTLEESQMSNQTNGLYDAFDPNSPYEYEVEMIFDIGYCMRRMDGADIGFRNGSYAIYLLGEVFDDLYIRYHSMYPLRSSADQCKFDTYAWIAYDNLASACYHNEQHLNSGYYRSYMISQHGQGTVKKTVVFCTGHILDGNPSSNSSSSSHSVLITPKMTIDPITFENKSDEDFDKETKYTVLHEISHQLGAPDHYCYGISGNSTHCINPNCYKCNGLGTLPQCVMSYRMDITNYSNNPSDLYCSNCIQTINNHIHNHHQKGAVS